MLPRRAAGTTLPAVLLLSVLLPVGPATAAGRPAADPSPSASQAPLPVVVNELADNAPCRPGSTVTARAEPWTQSLLGLDAAWALTRGSGTVVAVVDTGVDGAAKALSGRVTAVGDGGNDCVGHGTFVAGLAVGGPVEGLPFTGVAPQARVLAVRGTDLRGHATADSVASALQQAVAGGAKVAVVPFALASSSLALDAALRSAAEHDVLVVAPAGPDSATNNGEGAPPPRDYWPAAADGVLSVLDFGADGSRLTEAPEPKHADLAAPGDRVVGIGPRGDGVLTGSGPSLAVGLVGGAAALVRSYRPGLTAAQTAARLTATAFPADVPRLDVAAAVSATVAAPGAAPTSARPAVLPRPVSDGGARRRAVAITLGATGVAVTVGAAAWAVPRGRRRGWRAAH
ncbi:subtilase family protein [Streptomyces sp. TLI_171]|nr:subtilase family protein [Streptomyces sp. TLI_171]